MTTAEYEELENFLLHESELKHPMNLDALDGFMTALIIGPDTIMPSQWLPHVWSSVGTPESPVFQSDKHAERTIGLIMRMMNSIANLLEEQPADYVPLPDSSTFDSDDARRSAARMWCLGFIEGINMNPDSWNPLLKDEKGSRTIFAISAASGVLRDKLGLDEEKEYELWKLIPDAVLEIREFWMPHRQRVMESVRQAKADGIGRNDFCPCGSGKKYKKCCGR
ncbi:MAG: UPF0149 family protein [Chlorobaculum sp.]|nr:UPF0149 family protein [Chlorobaculum sp.]